MFAGKAVSAMTVCYPWDLKFDEDDVSQHLRGLKMKDNFITYTSFLAEDCSSGMIYRTGFRLNYCLTNKDDTSFLYKVNKKTKFFVA
jgi:hypothetical protein